MSLVVLFLAPQSCSVWLRERKDLIERKLGARLRFVEREGGKCNFSTFFPLPHRTCPLLLLSSPLSSLSSSFLFSTITDIHCTRRSPVVGGGRGGEAGAGGARRQAREWRVVLIDRRRRSSSTDRSWRRRPHRSWCVSSPLFPSLKSCLNALNACDLAMP